MGALFITVSSIRVSRVSRVSRVRVTLTVTVRVSRVSVMVSVPCWQARYEIVKECLRIRHKQPQIHNEKTL